MKVKGIGETRRIVGRQITLPPNGAPAPRHHDVAGGICSVPIKRGHRRER
jgi:hypothetical protein